MKIAGLEVQQDKNFYAVFTKQGIQIALIGMPPDGQVLYDAAALNGICKNLAKRWGVTNKAET